MTRFLLPFILLCLCASCGSSDHHFLTDGAYRQKVHEDFLVRKNIAAGRSAQLFDVFQREGLTIRQREALEFLYAYIPLCDLAELDGEYLLRQVDGAFRAREHFEWGKRVPEEVFRHFVLVPRINNEYLDEARDVFFGELKDRVAGMSMEEAALEVNHWCHEKVTYRATDPRTSSPLALVKTSWGRCGEESTFTAAALRAVGIPARQVYTPRWAHTDSNHAWIEVWVDGVWKYLGACEPEPELDMAWFSAPARRMMMGHTSVMGLYDGTEEVSMSAPYYSILNLTGNYADTRRLEVSVVNADGKPAAGVRVAFSVFNYAQPSAIATHKTNDKGQVAITTGHGDLLVSAGSGEAYGYAVARAGEGSVTIALDKSPGRDYEETYEVNVPREMPLKAAGGAAVQENAVRLAYEDSLRNAYMATFPDEAHAAAFAREHGLDPGDMWEALHASQGNWREIEQFIAANKANPRLFPFLRSMKEKDLRDTPAEYLDDHLNDSQEKAPGVPENIYVDYVLSPRIFIELIKPWRAYITEAVESSGLTNGEEILDYVKREVKVDTEGNYYACYLTPRGTHELKVADPRSRNIYFVALCRAAGIPARVEQASGKPQYWDGRWIDALFADSVMPANRPQGQLVLHNDPANIVLPAYSNHFTVALYSDGDFRTLDFRDAPETRRFPMRLTLDEGYYRLSQVSRANDGSVTVTDRFFNITGGSVVEQTVVLPEVKGKLFVKGIIDMNTIVELRDGEKTTLKTLARGKGLMLCIVDPAREPTRHILQELPALSDRFDLWGGGVVFMVPDDKITPGFDPATYKGLPAATAWGTDDGRALLAAATDALQLGDNPELPLVVYLNTNGGVLFSSVGYRIGIGEDILRTISMEGLH